MRKGAHSSQTCTAGGGGSLGGSLPALPLDLLHRDDCKKINVSLFRDASRQADPGQALGSGHP